MNRTEPTLLSSTWRYKYLVLVIAAISAALGSLLVLIRPQEDSYRAVTSIVLQEPMATDEVASSQLAGGRFVASQIEILGSPVVAAEAARLISAQGFDVDADVVLGSVSLSSTPESPLVSIIAVHPSPEVAAAIANQVAEGYRQVSRRQATATAQSQLTQLTAQLEGIEERLDSIDDELREARQEEAGLDEIEAQAREAVERIPELQEDLVEASSEETEAIRQEIEDLRDRLDVYAQVSQTMTGGPRQAALLEEQSVLVDRRAELQRLHDEVSIDAELAPDALALVQPAATAALVRDIGAFRTLAVATILGFAIGAAVAYFLAVSRRSFRSRMEPEALLHAPLLADIPDFADESLRTAVPVRDAPRSAAAEAFRFAASSLAVSARSRGVGSVVALSAIQGQGKTTALVNTAVAVAVQGSTVLVIDCDFGNQEASRLLLSPGTDPLDGITDVLDGTVSIGEATHRVELGNSVTVDVLPRGTRPTTAASSLQSDGAKALIDSLTAAYDLVLIDAPPFLQVAYASRLAEMAGGALIVIEHGSSYAEAEGLIDRLQLVGTPVMGYIYNRSPLRREMTMSEGSMMDVIGDAGFVESQSGVRRSRRPSERSRL